MLDLVRAGVSGYVLKDICPEKLVETIKEVAQGTPWLIRASLNCFYGSQPHRPGRHAQRRREIHDQPEMDILKY